MAMCFTGRFNELDIASPAMGGRARLLAMAIVVCLFFGSSACQQSLPEITPAPVDVSTHAPDPTNLPATANPPDAVPSETPQPASQINLAPEDLRGTIIHFWYPWSGEPG